MRVHVADRVLTMRVRVAATAPPVLAKSNPGGSNAHASLNHARISKMGSCPILIILTHTSINISFFGLQF